MAAAVIGLVVAALVARHLGPGDFGKVAYVYSMAAMFGMVGQLGLDGVVVRELKMAPEKVGVTLGTVMELRLTAFGVAPGQLKGDGSPPACS